MKKDILKEIKRMIRLAISSENIALADRYIEIARRISMKSRVRIPGSFKLFICKGCKNTLIPNRTARFRIKRKGGKTFVVISCLRCGHIYRKRVNRL